MQHNHVAIAGRLGADAEVRYSQSGNAWASLRVAVSAERGEKSRGATAWLDVKVFGGIAERFAGAKKGNKCWAFGYLVTESWESNGEKRSRLVVIADAAGTDEWSKPKEPKSGNKKSEDVPEVDYTDIPF